MVYSCGHLMLSCSAHRGRAALELVELGEAVDRKEQKWLHARYPLVICYIIYIANWNMAHLEIVDLPNLKMVVFSTSLCKRLPEAIQIDVLSR